MSKKQPDKSDPFFGLRYIAFCRSRLLDLEPGDYDKEALLDFARWQICKVRNVLFNDPIWEKYTQEEIFIEYFSLRFDEDEESCKKFLQLLKNEGDENAEADWLMKMTEKFAPHALPPEEEEQDEEFEDTFE